MSMAADTRSAPATIFRLHSGQVVLIFLHTSMQSRWNTCRHAGTSLHACPCWNSSRQIAHTTTDAPLTPPSSSVAAAAEYRKYLSCGFSTTTGSGNASLGLGLVAATTAGGSAGPGNGCDVIALAQGQAQSKPHRNGPKTQTRAKTIKGSTMAVVGTLSWIGTWRLLAFHGFISVAGGDLFLAVYMGW